MEETRDPILLYRYMKAEHALSAIRMGDIKVSTPENLNDPGDVCPCFVHSPRNREAARELAKKWRIQVDRRFGLVCMCSTIDDPAMWTHYADRHQGIAFEFDLPRGPDLLQVKYEPNNKRPQIDLDTYDDTWEEHTRRALSTKWQSWAYEAEYRLVLDLKDCHFRDGMYFSDAPLKHLTRVILGNQFGRHEGNCYGVDEEQVEQMLEDEGSDRVAVVRAELSHHGFRLKVPLRQQNYCVAEAWHNRKEPNKTHGELQNEPRGRGPF